MEQTGRSETVQQADYEELETLAGQICDHYCRFHYSCGEEELEGICSSCPLEKLVALPRQTSGRDEMDIHVSRISRESESEV